MKKLQPFMSLTKYLLVLLMAGCSKNTETTINNPVITPTPPVVDKGIPMFSLTTGSWFKYLDTITTPMARYGGEMKITITGTRLLPNGKTVSVWTFEKKDPTGATSYNKYGLSNGNFISVYDDTALKSPDPLFSYNYPLTTDSRMIETDVFSSLFLDTVRINKPVSVSLNGKTYDGVYGITKHINKYVGNGRYGGNYGDWLYQIDLVPGLGNIRMYEKYSDFYGANSSVIYQLVDYHIQ